MSVVWNDGGKDGATVGIETLELEILELEGCGDSRGCRPHGGALIDLDGDGDLDLLSGSSQGGVQWAENHSPKGQKRPLLKKFVTLIDVPKPVGRGSFVHEHDLVGPADRFKRPAQLRASRRVLTHHDPFVIGQLAVFQQDRIRDSELTDIVQPPAATQCLDLG